MVLVHKMTKKLVWILDLISRIVCKILRNPGKENSRKYQEELRVQESSLKIDDVTLKRLT